ncbi:hypothetical protein GWK08_08385 [Leptobacterium flavescens]|uniref:Uncharacterized protein n=1 Tax=Leptobacterium flavescens TaxID=472055 RepID=A0A6P0ULZ3_9FLAO|nr:hypothetical protein [Leptobacterium flavescens]NER13450.1 hypothetical protein [Leptobacterium flavescens]
MMKKTQEQCYKCGDTSKNQLEELYGYTICNSCKSRLGLFLDPTIEKHVLSFRETKREDPTKPTYKEEVAFRLDCLDKDYISKKIKLLHIQDRINNLS